MSLASVPSSIRSSLVITPMVLRPAHKFDITHIHMWKTMEAVWKLGSGPGPRPGGGGAGGALAGGGLTLGVHLLSNLQGVGVSKVRVSRGHRQQETVVFGHKLHQHLSDLVLDVRRLVAYRHLGDARQVHQSQVQHCAHAQGHQHMRS